MAGRARRAEPAVDAAATEDYDGLENVVELIRHSQFVQEARVDVFLDGVLLAAEQVQDVRLSFLENPPEVTGFEYFGGVLLTLALESTVGGAVLAAVTKKIFTPILRQSAVFRVLPKSAYGKQLADQAKRLGRMNAPGDLRAAAPRYPRRPLGAVIPPTARRTSQDTVSAALQSGVGGRAGLKQWDKGEVALYHASLEALVSGTDAVKTNLAATAKAGVAAYGNPKPRPATPLEITDTAGVQILAAAQQYASTTRMGIRVVHARFESLASSGRLTPEDLAFCADLFELEPLTDDAEGAVALNLATLRTRYLLLFEAAIWARLFGFDTKRGVPELVNGTLRGVDDKFRDYWIKRFAGLIDEWAASGRRYTGSLLDQKLIVRARYLREWMLEVSEQLPALDPGRLTRR